MEKKTNKAKLGILTFFEKIGWIVRLYSHLIKLAEIVPSMEIQYPYSLTSVFLHAEFISAFKTVHNPTVFMKTQK